MTDTATSQELALLEDDEAIGLALLRSLEDAGELRRSALRILDSDLSIKQYEIILAVAGQFKRTLSFAIGDLLNFGEAAFTDDDYGQWLTEVYQHLPIGVERPGDRYDRAAEITGLKRETLRNYSSVMARVAVSRRRDALSFGHHDTVAAVEPALQSEWLIAAEENGWGREELRRRMREAGVLKAPSQIQWSGGKLGSLAPELEPPAAPSAPPSRAPQAEPPATLLALPPGPPVASLADAVRALVELAEPADEGFYRLPRGPVDEIAALVAVEE